MAQTAIELGNVDTRVLTAEEPQHRSRSRDPSHEAEPAETQGTEFSLPPVDTGKQAWLFLAACWGVEAMTFGKCLSFLLFSIVVMRLAPHRITR
jgi:hypothetical protein